MRRVFIDTNILLDIAFEREGLVDESSDVINWCAAPDNGVDTFIAWQTVTNGYYLMHKSRLKDEGAREFLREALQWMRVAPVGNELALRAIDVPGGDYEDTLQFLSAEAAGVDLIVTRNVKHFRASPVRAVSPTQFLEEVRSTGRS